MKKLISFSLFAVLVILLLVVKNAAIAQTVSPTANQLVTVPSSPEYRWVNRMPPHRRMHVRHHRMRWQARAVRRMRLS